MPRPDKTPRPVHLVDDVRFNPRQGPCSVRCTCGWEFEGEDPDLVALGFSAHRLAVRKEAQCV